MQGALDPDRHVDRVHIGCCISRSRASKRRLSVAKVEIQASVSSDCVVRCVIVSDEGLDAPLISRLFSLFDI